MAEKTAIEWCDATFNPWWGCQKVSPACDHCYAERDAKRFAPGRVLWGVGSERRTFEDAHWAAPFKWAKTLPAKLGRRPRVFCASMADWLDLDAPLDQFVRLLELIRQTPELDWLLLSKRIGNWRKRLGQAVDALSASTDRRDLSQWVQAWLDGSPPANVWLGATMVNQDEADRDIPKLLQVPARVRFLSIEPMLGPIELRTRGYFNYCERPDRTGYADGTHVLRPPLDWVIAGGESGPGARPAHPDWFRSLRDQCAAAGVAFHLKQWGEWAHCDQPGVDMLGTEQSPLHRWADLDYSVRIGKKAAGRLLDGVQHDWFPEVA